MNLELSSLAIQLMKPCKKRSCVYFIASVLSTLATSVPIASADTVTVYKNSPNSSSEMVSPQNYTYGGGGSTYHPYYSEPNTVPYRLSPIPESSPYFSYPQNNSPSSTTEYRQPQRTMGLIYTREGGIDHFSMYMEWGNIAIQQNQPQVALRWYQKALVMRSSDKNAIRAIQALQIPTLK